MKMIIAAALLPIGLVLGTSFLISLVGLGPYRTLFPESESPHLLFAPVSCKIEQILIAI